MAKLQFKAWQCHDDRLALVQENAIKRVLGFSGIHDYQVLTEISELFTAGDISDYNLEGDEGTWAIDSGALKGTGGGAAQWYKVRHSTEVELGFIATFDKTGNRGGFLVRCDDNYKGYLLWWTGTNVGVSKIEGDTETKLTQLPCTETGTASVQVAVIPHSNESIDEVDTITFALWFDGKLLVAYTDDYYSDYGKKIGFAVYESDVITFDNLSVPQLHRMVEWTSVDPGEIASSGLSRVIAYDDIRVQARYDGSVKIWRPNKTSSDWTVGTGRELDENQEYQHYWPTHLRLVGALHEIDRFRSGHQGHIFALAQDPNAMSEEATADRGTKRHRRNEEQATTRTVQLAPNPVLEPEDLVTYDSDTWCITNIDWRAAWQSGDAGGAPVLQSALRLREYL